MSRYFIKDAKCGYDTCFDCCGPHTTVASAIKYKTDDGETGWMYCIQAGGIEPMIALHDEDVYEDIIIGAFPDINYEVKSFGDVNLDIWDKKDYYKLFFKNKNSGAAKLIQYAYTLCVCPTFLEAELLDIGKGYYSDEIEIPLLNDERRWYEDLKEDLKE